MALVSTFLIRSNVGQKSFHRSSNCKIQRWMYCQRTLCQSRDRFNRPHNQWNLNLDHKYKFHFVSIRSLLKWLGSLCILISQRPQGTSGLCWWLFDEYGLYCHQIRIRPWWKMHVPIQLGSFRERSRRGKLCHPEWCLHDTVGNNWGQHVVLW
jgi:hypothetical protein